jgi:hypothetical protein
MILQKQTINIRINNIGAKIPTYIGTPPINAHRILSIVQYYPCSYYGKLEEYLDDGWEKNDTYLQKNNSSISLSLFSIEELSISIAKIEYNPRELCTDLTSVGERLLHLTKKDREDFFEVYELATHKLREICSEDD